MKHINHIRISVQINNIPKETSTNPSIQTVLIQVEKIDAHNAYISFIFPQKYSLIAIHHRTRNKFNSHSLKTKFH